MTPLRLLAADALRLDACPRPTGAEWIHGA